MMKRIMAAAAAMLLVGTSVMPLAAADAGVGATTTQVFLYLNSKVSYVNGTESQAAMPPGVKDGKTYVPLKFLGDAFGIPVQYHVSDHTVSVALPNGSVISIDQVNKSVMVDGTIYSWDSIAMMQNNTTMVQLTWICDLIGATYTYDNPTKKIGILYMNTPDTQNIPGQSNHKPTAKFALDKQSYRLGEPVNFIDLSYDVDGDGLAHEQWDGKQDAYFQAGVYPVTLKVTDAKGNVSETYTRNVTVENTPYLSEDDFPWYYAPEGTIFKQSDSVLNAFKYKTPATMQYVPPSSDEDRLMLVSDSPETIKSSGILYADTINGKGRLYAHHVNGTDQTMTIGIVATNEGTEPATIVTTNKGEVNPTRYTNLIGYQAGIDFSLKDQMHEELTVQPGQSVVFRQMPQMGPQQGVNMIYDVETDQPVKFSFVSGYQDDSLTDIAQNGYQQGTDGHVRGTYVASVKSEAIDASTLTGPTNILIGDGKVDPFLTGNDALNMVAVKDTGNYGVTYRIEIDHPGKLAIGLLERSGPFKGGFSINGLMTLAPKSGMLTPYDGLLLLKRTNGTSDNPLVIEFIPPAGSALPISLMLMPLDPTK